MTQRVAAGGRVKATTKTIGAGTMKVKSAASTMDKPTKSSSAPAPQQLRAGQSGETADVRPRRVASRVERGARDDTVCELYEPVCFALQRQGTHQNSVGRWKLKNSQLTEAERRKNGTNQDLEQMQILIFATRHTRGASGKPTEEG